jgi:hypothetical protein
MKTVVDRLARRLPIELDQVDISADAALEAQYGLEIPVLFVEGKKAAKYRVTEEELARILANRVARPG